MEQKLTSFYHGRRWGHSHEVWLIGSCYRLQGALLTHCIEFTSKIRILDGTTAFAVTHSSLGGRMKTDLKSLKKELSRLTDVNYIKKELNRLAGEIKRFDVHMHLTPQAKERLEYLEERFNKALKSLQDLQRQVDSGLERFIKNVRKTRMARTAKKAAAKASGKSSVGATRKKTTRKAAAKKTSKKAASK
jgi:hypothetical protein